MVTLSAQSRKPLSWQGRIGRLAEVVISAVLGQDVRLVRATELERLRRLAYRETLREAEQSGDEDFLNHELERHQLTGDDLEQLRRRHTPLQEWPDSAEGLIAERDSGPLVSGSEESRTRP